MARRLNVAQRTDLQSNFEKGMASQPTLKSCTLEYDESGAAPPATRYQAMGTLITPNRRAVAQRKSTS